MLPLDTIFKPMPVAVPVAKVCTCVVKPLSEVKALPPTIVDVEDQNKFPFASVIIKLFADGVVVGRVRM